MFLSSPIAAINSTQDILQAWQNSPIIKKSIVHRSLQNPIVIFYDQSDPNATETATALSLTLDYLYDPIILKNVNSLEALQKNWQHYKAATVWIYVFQSDTSAIYIGEDAISWDRFAFWLRLYSFKPQILTLGNSYMLDEYLADLPSDFSENIRYSRSEVLDSQVAYFYVLWELAAVFEQFGTDEYQDMAQDLQRISLKYLESDFQSLFSRTIEPQKTLGKTDINKKEQFVQSFKAEHPERLQALYSKKALSKLSSSEKPTVFVFNNNKNQGSQNVVDALSFKEGTIRTLGETKYLDIAEIPKKSGQQGPIGKVLDLLLGLFSQKIGDKLGIKEDSVQEITSILNELLKLIGMKEGKFDTAGVLKSTFKVLADKFPAMKKYEKYVLIAIEAFFAFQEKDYGKIADLIVELADALIPNNATYRDTLLTVLDFSAEAVNSALKSDDFLQGLLRFFIKKFTVEVAYQFFNNTLASFNVTQNQIERSAHLFASTFGIGTDFLLNLNITEIFHETLPNYIVDVLNSILEGLFGGNSSTLALSENNTAATSITISSNDDSNKVSKLSTYDVAVRPELLRLVKTLGATITGIFGATLKFKLPLSVIISLIVEGLLPPVIYPKLSSNVNAEESALQGAATKPRTVANNFTNEILPELSSFVEEKRPSLYSNRKDLPLILDDAIDKYLGAYLSFEVRLLLRDLIILIVAMQNENLKISTGVPTISTILDRALNIIDDYFVEGAEEQRRFRDIVNQTIMTGLFVATYLSQENSKMRNVLERLLAGSHEKFDEKYGDKAHILIQQTVNLIRAVLPNSSFTELIDNYYDEIVSFVQLGWTIYKIVSENEQFSWKGVLQAIYATATAVIPRIVPQINTTSYLIILQGLFPRFFAEFFGETRKAPTPQEVVTTLKSALTTPPWNLDPSDTKVQIALELIDLLVSLRDVYDDGMTWIINKLKEWLAAKTEKLIDQLLDKLDNIIKKALDILHWEGEYNLELGAFSLFSIKFELGLDLGLTIDRDRVHQFIQDIFFNAKQVFKGTPAAFLVRIIKFIRFTPQFYGSLEIGDFGSGKNSFFNFLLESLGLEVSFSGGASFKIELFSLQDAIFAITHFFKVAEWSFKFSLSIGKTFTLFDFLTAGVGGGALNKVAEFIGLDSITITIQFTIGIEVSKRAATATEPEIATFELIIGITVTLRVGFDLAIATLELSLSVAITLTFFQDLSQPAPMRIFLDLLLKIKVKVNLLGVAADIEFMWHPIDNLELTNGKEVEDAKMGPDADMDGLSDQYEATIPGLDANSNDTDGDGLTDRFESQFANTDPTKPDTDDDGLNDFMEFKVTHTNPRVTDTDNDGLTDYEEVAIYGTNPLSQDTDKDGLTDTFEINHAWDISLVTPSVTSVIIGGQSYNDRTDPLNPDTDNDGLLDGQEGEFGPNYADNKLYNGSTDQNNATLIFNNGYTHPLDNDTDDDGQGLQLWNGTVVIFKDWPYKMTDGEEVQGISVPFINATTGEVELKIVRTNPVNPDTDGDTGADNRDPPPSNLFLNSDGYELSLNPPSNPTDGDTDNDGLIDGLEGTLRYDSNHTYYNNPDTDGDGLGDLQELLMGTDPRNPDSDKDLIADGQEVYKFGTDPFINDTDGDGLLDGEETFFYHTNPHAADTDGDGIIDGREANTYFTDPVDEDTDNDGLTDLEEIAYYHTNPFESDTDQDGLLDGEELEIYHTDPLLWDTDNDTIWYLDENGNITFSMSDGDEIKYGTDNTNPDTDGDGISDGWELYLASGKVPTYRMVNLSAVNNDTDQDGLLDGSELVIVNSSSIIYPYIAFNIFLPFKTAPDSADTDQDGLTDYEEVMSISVSRLRNPSVIASTTTEITNSSGEVIGTEIQYYLGTDPSQKDTDNDSLSDYNEVIYHGTDPTTADTDGDGLKDNQEYTLVTTLEEVPNGVLVEYNITDPNAVIYQTDALNPDTDGDLLPDGIEIDMTQYVWTTNNTPIAQVSENSTNTYLQSDPFNADQNNNSIIDGLEFDGDYDGLPDGHEFFNGTVLLYLKNKNVAPNATLLIDPAPVTLAQGGPRNPDSDRDGVIDGLEVYQYQTNVSNYDSDGDSWSDGLEILIGTDPLNRTDNETVFTKIGAYVNSSLLILSPSPQGYEESNAIPIIAKSFGSLQFTEAWYRWRKVNSQSWSENQSLLFNEKLRQWEDFRTTPWTKGKYILEVYGRDTNGNLRVSKVKFSVGLFEGNILPFVPLMMLFFVGGVLTTVSVAYILNQPRFSLIFKKIASIVQLSQKKYRITIKKQGEQTTTAEDEDKRTDS